MANFSDRHRRRLHLIQHDSNRSEPAVTAAPVPSEQDVTPVIPDDLLPTESIIASETHSELQPPPLVEPKTASRSKSVKPKRKNKPQTPSSRRYIGRRNLMKYFRHTLALAILVTFGYLYSQQRNAESVDTTNLSAEPFSNWEDIAKAPAFNADTVSMSQQGTPDPIPMTQAGDSELDGIPAGLTNWIESKDSKKAGEPPVIKEVAEINESASKISKLKKRSMSLWDEPGLATNEIRGEMNRQVESIASTSGIPDLPAETNHQHQAPTQNNGNQGTQELPGMMESWREFRLGSGKQTTVCVVDQSISRDTLLLSTIFANIRREWFSDVSRSREQSLVMLIANQQVTNGVSGKYFAQQTPSTLQKQQEMQRKLKAVAPSRIVYISRGKGEYGQIKFSSEQESMDAILSVPGLFRITSAKQKMPYRSGQPEQVHIELPAYSQAQEAATAQLLFTALSGEWNNSQHQASRDTYGEQSKKETIVQDNPSRESHQDHSTQPRPKKRRVEILPSPSAYRQQAKAKYKGARNSFFKLPPPPMQTEN